MKRFVYIDILNIIATFFVLTLHSTQAYFHSDYSSSVYLETKVIQVICIPAVLLFFMISGAMLLDYRKHESTIMFLKKRFKRVIVPFLVWSIIWYIFDIFWTANPGPIPHLYPSINDFIISLFNNNINNIFWFFYAIIALYLATPIFSSIVNQHKNKLFLYVIVVYFLVNSVGVFFNELFGLKINMMNFNQPLLSSSYIGYFLLGYLIHNNFFSERFENIMMFLGGGALFLALIMIYIMPRLVVTSITGAITFLYSTGIFILIKRIVSNLKFKDSLKTIFAKLASASLGVYLIHPIFIKLFDKLIRINQYHWIHIYLYPVLLYIVCVSLILLIKKLPGVKRIIP